MKGIWASPVDVKPLKSAGFDTMISYLFRYRSEADQQKTLNSALNEGMKVIPVLHLYWKDNNTAGAVALASKWKTHPALGGWMLFDEPRISHVSIEEQIDFYNAIKRADPDHMLYTTFMADPLTSKHYNVVAFDMAIVDYYPLRGTGDWREFMRTHLDAWVDSTSNLNIIPVMQGFGRDDANGENDFANPIGTIAEQYKFWRERGMTSNGYAIYCYENDKETHSPGVQNTPGLLEEVTQFNKSNHSEPDEPDGPVIRLLRAVDQPEVFIVFINVNIKRWIQNPHTFNELGGEHDFNWDDIEDPVTLEAINRYPTGDTMNTDPDELTKRARSIYFPADLASKMIEMENGITALRNTWDELKEII